MASRYRSDDPLYNSRVIKTFLEYLEKYHPDVDIDSILKSAGMTKYEVEDQGHWFNQRQVDRFHEILVAKTGNPDIAREAGRFAVSSEALGALKQYLLGLMSLMSLYVLVEKLYPILSRGATVKAKKLGANKVEIVSVPKPEVDEKPYQCDNRLGITESVAKLFTKNFAKVEHPSCFHKGDNSCRYVITWEKTPSLIWKRIRNHSLLLGALLSVGLFFVLPMMTWFVLVFVCALIIMMISFYSERLEKRELAITIETQGDAAKDLLEEINIRYNDALLVQEIGQGTSKLMDIQNLLETVTEVMEKRLDFDRGGIWLANKEKTHLAYNTGYGYDPQVEKIFRNTGFHLDRPRSRG